MLTEKQCNEFNERGFLNGGPLLTDLEVETLRSEVMRVIAERDRPDVAQPVLVRNLSSDDNAPVWQIVDIWMASPAFKALMERDEITGAIAQLTGAEELRIWHDQIQYKPPEIGGYTDWHQDAPLWPIIRPMTEVTAWVALDNADESNGCMSMVPGSHRWGDHQDFLNSLDAYEKMPDEYQGRRVDVVRCPVAKGEVHFHHALTWHGSHANTSGRPRRAIALHYMTGDTRYVSSGRHVMQQFVNVGDGEPLSGDAFPIVYPR